MKNQKTAPRAPQPSESEGKSQKERSERMDMRKPQIVSVISAQVYG